MKGAVSSLSFFLDEKWTAKEFDSSHFKTSSYQIDEQATGNIAQLSLTFFSCFNYVNCLEFFFIDLGCLNVVFYLRLSEVDALNFHYTKFTYRYNEQEEVQTQQLPTFVPASHS